MVVLTAAIPLLAMRILVITRDPPSLFTSSSGEAAPWQSRKLIPIHDGVRARVVMVLVKPIVKLVKKLK